MAGRKSTPRGKTGKAAGTIEARPRKRRPRSLTTLAEVEAFLNERVNVERMRVNRIDRDVFKLDRMRALLAALGDPHEQLKFAHVAGSKGKGSVCEMLASCLSGCGYTVGLYTSPHLVSVTERIRINNVEIGEESIASVMTRCRNAADDIAGAHGDATYFELTTAAAIQHFADQAVDIAVLETGLGGRLDSTNVVMPEIVGLTAIQLEHTAILGEDLPTIASEKAGIIKPGVPAVTIKQDEAVLDVFRAVAEERGSELLVLGEQVEFSTRFEAAHAMGPHVRVCVASEKNNFEHLPVPLPGQHQAENCGLALAMLDRLTKRGFPVTERGVAAGLAATPRRGRLEQVFDRPRVIVDGAHTAESIRALVHSLGASESFDSLVVIFGCAADKDVDEMLREIGRGADKIIFTKAQGNPRALDADDLQARFSEVGEKMSQVEPDVKSALNTAARAVGRDDLICVTGSFYLAGEAKALLEAKKRELVSAAV